MNRTIARILPTAVLGTALLASAAAFPMGPRHPGDSERMLAHMTEQLDLSEAQAEQVGQVLSSDRAQAQADRRRMQEIREALEAQAGDFNAGEVQKLADELGEITSRMAFQMTSKRAEVYTILTPEQREELAEFRQQRGDRRGKREQRD